MVQQTSDLTEFPPALESFDGSGDETFFGAGWIQTLTLLASHKRIIAKFTAVATALGLGLCFMLPVRFTATVKIMPPQQTPSSAAVMMNQLGGGGAGSLAAVASGGFSLRNPNEIYMGLLHSRPIADGIINQFNLLSAYRARNMTSARKRLETNTQVTAEKSGMISISVTDADKDRAAAIANAHTEGLRLLTRSLAVTEASQRRLFYENQLKRSKDSLVEAELAFQQVQQKKGLVSLDAQARSMIESVAVVRAQIAAKQVQLEALRSYSTDRNPDVQLAEKELSAMQAEAARLEQHNHSSEFGSLSLQEVPSAGLEFLRAQHEFLYQQTLYDLLIKQYDVARLDEAKEAAVIQVVEPAIPPEQKSSPHRTIILVWALMLGTMTGCGYVLALKRIRQSPRFSQSVDELRRALLAR